MSNKFVSVVGVNLTSDIASGGLQRCAAEICHARMTRTSQEECRGILEWSETAIMIHMIMLAAGESRRFGGNKLLCNFEGKQLYRHVFDKLLKLNESRDDLSLCVVTQYEEIKTYAESHGIPVIWNDHACEGITSSLKLGIECVGKTGTQDYYSFFVSDQPHMNPDTVADFYNVFLRRNFSMGCVRADGHRGNPCIFHVKYRDELRNLTGDVGGKQLFSKYSDECFFYDVGSKIELVDYDEKW